MEKSKQQEKSLEFYIRKHTVNLVMREARPKLSRRAIGVAIAALVLLGVAAQFLVRVPLAQVAQLEAAAERLEQQVEQLRAVNEGFDEVQAEYDRYFAASSVDERFVAEYAWGAELLEEELFTQVKVANVSFFQENLTVELEGVQPGQTAALMSRLSERAYVDSVNLYTVHAAETEGEGARVSMTIVFAPEGGEGQ